MKAKINKREALSRKNVSMLAVLQMFNLYEKQLKKAQSLRRKVLPWRDGITHSSESEIVPHSLNLKEKWKPTGLLRRLMNGRSCYKFVLIKYMLLSRIKPPELPKRTT